MPAILAYISVKWLRGYLISHKILKRDFSVIGRRNIKIEVPLKAGFLFYLILIVTLVMPATFLNSAPAHAQGIMRWDIVPTPGYYQSRFDIVSPGDIIDCAVGSGGTIVAVVRIPATTALGSQNVLYVSKDNGITWSDAAYKALLQNDWLNNEIFNVAIAPDSADIWAITVGIQSEGYAPRHVWFTDEGGTQWVDADLVLTGTAETIRSIDISPAYGTNWHDIGVTTVTGTGAGSFYIVSTKTWGLWLDQGATSSSLPVPSGSADYFKIRFSPSYVSDFSVALLYATSNATYFNVGFRDVKQNTTLGYAFQDQGVEVRNTAMPANASPGLSQLVIGDLKLPSDFVGQSSAVRRAYVSLDCNGLSKSATSQDGVFRVDDTHVYVLMDTTNIADKSIYSIAYYGTYAQGKLLIGEHYGYPCTATVPTWFTDSPTTCPIPCWYPALKPTTGAAAQGLTPGPVPGTCSGLKVGIGSARVAWDADGTLAFAGTGSLDVQAGSSWYSKLLLAPIKNDESAIALSRNNGETWNQIGLINTTIDWLNDIAPTPDCGTLYLASVNHNAQACAAFDSVWRSTMNSKVSNPLPPSQSMGYYWERVLCHPTSISCNTTQSEAPILRVPQGCKDKPDGETVAWAARLTTAQMWSPDYGDFWADINSTDLIQDFTFESSTILYDLSPGGLVQKLTYSGTSWTTKNKRVDSRVMKAHTIAAVPDGKILVGAATDDFNGAVDAASFSPVGGDQWIEIPRGSTQIGNVHVAFDADFADNKFVYLADDKRNESGKIVSTYAGSIFREEVPAYIGLDDADMMSSGNSAHAEVNWPSGLKDPPHRMGQFGVVAARTGLPQPALYTAHDNITTTLGMNNSAVCRTLKPWQAMPKFGVPWDCLDIFSPPATDNVSFTLEPSSLKYCGCCTIDSNTTLFAIDNKAGGSFGADGYNPVGHRGVLWAYADCLAKKGPVLLNPEDGGFVGSDPVTGRNQQVDLSWEQLCVAISYELQIAKDKDFSLKINPAVTRVGGIPVIVAVTGSIPIDLDEINMTQPRAWISPGSLPEAGTSYFWRLRVTKSATGQLAISPWSEIRSFSIKPGFIVNTPVEGIQLLSPVDKCSGCQINSVALSWTPIKEATKYEVWLAKDAQFQKLLKKVTTTNTAYQYPDALEYSTSYFWRVRAIEINGTPNVGDWSATSTFTTVSAPPPQPTQAEKEKQQQKQQNPGYAWVVIAIIVAVPICLLVFIVLSRKPRY